MKNCATYNDLMQRELDGELSELETKRLEKHLQLCPTCAEDYQTLQEVDILFRGMDEVKPPAELSQLIMNQIRIEEEVAEESYQAEAQRADASTEKVAAVQSPPIGGILVMVVVACLNGFFFLSRLVPFLGVKFTGTERQIVGQLFIQFFARFAVVGRHTGEALQTAFQAVVHYLPWQLIGIYTLVCGLSIYGFIYYLRQGRKGGDLT